MSIGLKIVNGDIVINDSGTLDVLTPAEKCSRDLGKMLSTELEYTGNETSYYRYNPYYGTDINNQLLYEGLSRAAVRDMFIIRLNASFANYISNQEIRNNLDLEEIITEINFDVQYDSDDLRRLIIDIKYSTLYNDNESLGVYTQLIG